MKQEQRIFNPKLKMESQIKGDMRTFLQKSEQNKKVQNDKRNPSPNKPIMHTINRDNRLRAYKQINNNTYNPNDNTKYNPSKSTKAKTNYPGLMSEQTESNNEDISNEAFSNEQPATKNKATKHKRTQMVNGSGVTFSIVEEKIYPHNNNLNESQKGESDVNDNKELIDQFEEYIEEKFSHLEKTSSSLKKEKITHKETIKKDDMNVMKIVPLYNNITNSYLIGSNILPNSIPKNSLICYHKIDKWVAYINHNVVVIENFHNQQMKDQIILKEHTYGPFKITNKLTSLKLSNGGRILYGASTTKSIPPTLFFYLYTSQKTFNYIRNYNNKNISTLLDYAISPMNNMCIILYNNNKVSCIDFDLGEELIQCETLLSTPNDNLIQIKWNSYLSNMEFCTISNKSFTIYHIDIKSLQFTQTQSLIDFFVDRMNKQSNLSSFDFTPPLSVQCVICVLLALSNGYIFLFDYNKDVILKQYTPYELFLEEEIKLFDISVSMYYVTVLYEGKVKYFRMPLLGKVEYSNIELFNKPKGMINHDNANIISCDIDLNNPKCEGMTLTNKGGLFYINYNEECTVRLSTFIPEQTKSIKQLLLINANIKQISLQSATCPHMLNSNKYDYYIVTAHQKGMINIWTIPQYSLIYSYEINDEIMYMQRLPNDTKVLVCYKSSIIRCFDIEETKLIGKFNLSEVINDNNYFKLISFFPDAKYFLGIEEKTNETYLCSVKSYSPLSIHFNQLLPETKHDIINEIGIHKFDPFNFIFTSSGKTGVVTVYNRKFTNLIQDLSFEKSLPNYGRVDVFDINKFCLENNFELCNEYNSSLTKVYETQCHFSTMSSEKDVIYIFSRKHNVWIKRDFKLRIITKIVKFDAEVLSVEISSSGEFALFSYENVLKFTELDDVGEVNEDGVKKENIVKLNIKNKKRSKKEDDVFPVVLSHDSKVIGVYDEYAINFYIINK